MLILTAFLGINSYFKNSVFKVLQPFFYINNNLKINDLKSVVETSKVASIYYEKLLNLRKQALIT